MDRIKADLEEIFTLKKLNEKTPLLIESPREIADIQSLNIADGIVSEITKKLSEFRPSDYINRAASSIIEDQQLLIEDIFTAIFGKSPKKDVK
jgi:hypothetical protein